MQPNRLSETLDKVGQVRSLLGSFSAAKPKKRHSGQPAASQIRSFVHLLLAAAVMAKRLGGRNGNPELGRLVNNYRLFGPIGHIPPAEAEANYYAAKENLDMAA